MRQTNEPTTQQTDEDPTTAYMESNCDCDGNIYRITHCDGRAGEPIEVENLAAETPYSDVAVVRARDDLVFTERETGDSTPMAHERRRTASLLACPDLR